MSAGKGVTGLVLGAWCAIAIGCAARANKTLPSTAAPGTSADRHAEIEQLDQEIDAELARRGLPPAPEPACAGGCGATAATAMSAHPPIAEDTTCKPGPSETCKDSCALADSICTSSARICTIAQQLGGTDTYANDTCEKGKTSCETSRGRCCSCQL